MTIEKIALQVAKEWQMSFGGVEFDFALEVAKRAVEAKRDELAKYFDTEHGGSVLAGDEISHIIRMRSNV